MHTRRVAGKRGGVDEKMRCSLTDGQGRARGTAMYVTRRLFLATERENDVSRGLPVLHILGCLFQGRGKGGGDLWPLVALFAENNKPSGGKKSRLENIGKWNLVLTTC